MKSLIFFLRKNSSKRVPPKKTSIFFSLHKSIKAFSMLADKLSEDEIIKGEGTGYQTASEIEKEISELTEDGSPYWNKTHPNHAKTVDRVFKLREQLNG